MDKIGLVTTIRDDQLLLLNKENATFAPPSRRPSPLYLLSFHRDRILAAAQAAGRSCKELEGDKGLELLACKIQSHRKSANRDVEDALKVRIVLSASNALDVTSTLVPSTPQSALFPKSLSEIFKSKPTYRIYISPIKTKPSLYTRFKTTERSAYDKVRSVLPKSNPDSLLTEILLINEKGDIMEGSFTTPYFNHGGWITPAKSSGGNLGVTRRWALGKGLCEEGLVNMNSVQAGSLGERIILSNGARGFGWGRVEPLVDL
ncbi:uncharacterized protein KY384_006119 [Bacidia gigantensis]|uniref:uncharacterized protein n=1 Tax=Bacidia gigantensis TaxID=2732470 RepID=UPI001D04B07A|nr:uncharacterized protein KY384_006119 [Bacidia gigantensis]KAG8529482.1 hypothetical protein KY384_006119 [Bacidia gigantensis]